MSAESKNPPPPRNPLVDGVVRAERLLQIALILPLSVVVGWLIGAGLDKWLHQHWIYLVGVVFGSVAGFYEVFRVVQNTEKQDS
ncbi:MAG TPA: AtpZ/AtpI family protein [Acidobacteriaceae bacterium]|nr:AtpZ/AtpI family protein [Acidobacteriaceae bacterium]